MEKVVAPFRHVVLEEPGEEYDLQSISVGPRGEAVGLWCPRSVGDKSATESLHGSTDRRPWEPSHAIVTTHFAETVEAIHIETLDLDYPLVQPIPEGVIIVEARCELTDAGPELNAAVFDTQGRLQRRGCLGDGIQVARTTPSGHLWLGYWDEGVFGNYGWGDHRYGNVEPLGSHGVVLWSTSDFKKLWEPVSGIADVFAVTLLGEDLWATMQWASGCVDYRIKHFSYGIEQTYPAPVDETNSIITDGHLVATFGQRNDPFTFRVWDWSDDPEIGPMAMGRIVIPGLKLDSDLTLVGHADELNIFMGTTWSKLSLSELIS